MSQETLRAVLIISFMAMALAMSVLSSIAFKRLRETHPDTWEALGQPSLFWNSSPRNRWLFTRFVWSGSYRELNDPALDRLVVTLKTLSVLSGVAFAAVFLMLMR
jgi:hypothetical protein